MTRGSGDTPITRRRALSLAGVGLVGSLAATSDSSASSHDAEVYWYDGSWWARNGDAVDCGRGIFTVSGSSGIAIEDVWLEGCGSGGLIQDTRDVIIDGGTITGNAGEGIRIDSRSGDEHPHTRNLAIENNDYGVYETGPDTGDNAILGNDFCDNATADVETYASSTTVSGNTYGCSGGSGIATGTYRITSVDSGKFLEVADASTENGATVQEHSDTGHACQEWYVEETGKTASTGSKTPTAAM